MKKIIYILIGICLGVFGCIHDETTGPHLDISDLSTTFEDSVIYITSTENLRLDAGSFIVQTDSNCPLEYTWSAGIQVLNFGNWIRCLNCHMNKCWITILKS